jgi:hypothetical protein
MVNEGGVPRRMSKRRAFFKRLVNSALTEPRRSGGLLLKVMEQYDLLKDEQIPKSMVIEFVRSKQEDDDKD